MYDKHISSLQSLIQTEKTSIITLEKEFEDKENNLKSVNGDKFILSTIQ
jgi:hypothetical protein